MTEALAAVAARRQHCIRDQLLVRRQHRVKRTLDRELFVEPGQGRGLALLLPLQARDRVRPLVRFALREFCPHRLDAFVAVGRLLAQGGREGVPLRLLRVRDLQRRLDVSQTASTRSLGRLKARFACSCRLPCYACTPTAAGGAAVWAVATETAAADSPRDTRVLIKRLFMVVSIGGC